MKNLFNDISQEERNRILEMHQSATRKNYLSEQSAPAPAPDPIPTGPTATRRPTVVPDGDRPQEQPPIYRQIDVATFNPQFELCWKNTDSGKYYSSIQFKTMNGGDEEEILKTSNSKAIRMAMFNTINQFYLNSLTNPMSSGELERLWNTNIKNLPVTYSFTDPYKKPRVEAQLSSNVGTLIPSVYTNERQMKIDYVNTFNCAMRGI